MENGKEERRTQPNGDARLDNDCGKLGDASASSIDSNRDLGARCKTKCLSYNIPSANESGKLNNNSEVVRRTRRKRRTPGFDKVNKTQFHGDLEREDFSESDEDSTLELDLQSNGEVASSESKSLNGVIDQPTHLKSRLDSYIRNNVAGFEPVHNKCPDKKDDPEVKANLSSDSDNDGDIEEEEEEDDGMSADECCIYTYRGDREGAADLPSLFGADGQDVECVASGDGMGNLVRRPGEVPQPRCSSPEMDFLEMDFDPGPPTGRDSDESGQDSQEPEDVGKVSHSGIKSELPVGNQLDINSICLKNNLHEDSSKTGVHNSPSSSSSLTPPPVTSHPSPPNNLGLSHRGLEEFKEEPISSSEVTNSFASPKPNTPSTSDSSRGAVPKSSIFNQIMEPRLPSNANWNTDALDGCRRKQCLDGSRQEMEKCTRGLLFAGMNGCESVAAEHGEVMQQSNLIDSAMNSPSFYVPVFICLPMQTFSPSKNQPKLLQIQTNSNLAHCHGHRKLHGDHSSYLADRGAADVIVNTLSALDITVPYGKVQQGLCLALPSGCSGKLIPPNGLVEYLEWRANCKGAPSQVEIAHSIEWASDGVVMSRFFPAAPSPTENVENSARYCSSPKSFLLPTTVSSTASASTSFINKAQVAGVNLMDWLYYWMKRGAVPIVTLNSQDWVDCIKSSGGENPDHNRMCGFSEKSEIGPSPSRGCIEEGERWAHQMVIGLGPRGAYLSGCANEQCCAEVRSLACLLVSGETKGVHVGRTEVVARWRGGSNDLRPLVNPKIPLWRKANVLGAVVSAIRESCASMPRSSSSSSTSTSSSSSASATPPAISPASPLGISAAPSPSSPPSNSPFIVLPVARHRTGITLVLRKDSHALEELLAAPNSSLSDILSPSSGNILNHSDSAPSNLLRPSVWVPPFNGKGPPSTHASISLQQTRPQDSI